MARVMLLGELLDGSGHGWLETMDPEDGYTELLECVWLYGGVLTSDPDGRYEDITTRRDLMMEYDEGLARIWNDRPSEEQRQATPWR